MDMFEVVIVPAVLIAAFLGTLLVLAVVIARRYLAVLSARRQEARVLADRWQDRYRAVRDQMRAQADVIASVITELESRRATYETFPQDVLGALCAAHEKASQLERNELA